MQNTYIEVVSFFFFRLFNTFALFIKNIFYHLQNTFIMSSFLILGGYNYANRRLVYEFEKLGKEARIIKPDYLLPFVSDTKADRIYIQNDSDKPRRIYKNSVNCIVPRIGYDLQFYSKCVEQLNKNIGIPTTADATALLNAQDKIRTIQLLSQNGIKTPRTFAVKSAKNVAFMVDTLGGFPVVAKLIYGSRGVGIFILTDELSGATALDAFTSQGHSLLLQQFIETAKDDKRKHDFRAVVVDGKIVASIKRNSVGGDFRTNASIKEDCEDVELDEDMKAIAIKAAKAVGLDCAGVDLARDCETGEVYVYEVNGNFNFKSTEKFSKKNVAKTIVEFAIKQSGKDITIDASRQSPLSNDVSFSVLNAHKSIGIPFLSVEDTDNELGEDLEMSSNGTAKPIRYHHEMLKASIGEQSIFNSPIKPY
jgi:ribosomal protein S6--L-glutamate ligase